MASDWYILFFSPVLTSHTHSDQSLIKFQFRAFASWYLNS